MDGGALAADDSSAQLLEVVRVDVGDERVAQVAVSPEQDVEAADGLLGRVRSTEVTAVVGDAAQGRRSAR